MSRTRPVDVRQEEFPFPSLDFPGRTTVTVPEIAERIGLTEQHVINLIEAGELRALDAGRRSRGRAWYRIPLESYHAWILQRMSAPAAENPLLTLTTPSMERLFLELAARLVTRGRNPAELLDQPL